MQRLFQGTTGACILSLLIPAVMLLFPDTSVAGLYTNFNVAIYIPVGVVQRFENLENLTNDWSLIRRQLKFDKVYIEVQRDRNLASPQLIEQVKKFFLDRGVRVAGGMALSDGGSGQFRSFCYTDPADRQFIKQATELAARHFDEIIQDDFFFVTTKNDSDIAAKGTNSWTQFRLNLMNEAAENLIIKPARAVNPKVKLVIKFPNWYEHFQGLGYDLDREPKLFDGIYTGTETRDPVITDQHLQQYESYLILRYFENIAPAGAAEASDNADAGTSAGASSASNAAKTPARRRPGRNGGGWVDTFSIRYLDRYAEQLWDTLFAKAREMTLFEWSAMTRPIRPGEREPWQDLHTSFDFNQLLQAYTNNAPAGLPEPTMARVAGYALEQADAFLGKLGNPIGIAGYKPYQSTGEDFLHNYLGMIGIPMDLHPQFPTNADVVLLTESAKFDSDIVAKIKGQLVAGKSVVITSGLLHALQHRGIEDIIEARYTDHKVYAHEYAGGFGAGSGAALDGKKNDDILFPEIFFLTNDAWPVVRLIANGNGYPLLLMDRYSRGVLYIWTIPENFSDLYRLPPGVTGAIKNYVMRGFPVRLDGPAQVALFAYDNHTFIVESYLPAETDVKVSLTGDFTRLKNLVTGEVITGSAPTPGRGRWRDAEESRTSFNVHLQPHSYAVFAAEK